MVKTSVVMRARNDMPIVARTLRQVARQTVPVDLIVFDDGSTDGTREEAMRFSGRVYPVPGGCYVPGRVLNEGMRRAGGEVVAFLNSDCVPADAFWLEHLIAPFEDPRTAATFGRQVPRPGCHPPFARDTEDTFGDGGAQRKWRQCFSMASSAIRRDVWQALPFDESLSYSEDIDWSWRARKAGFDVHYVAGSVVEHSHNYTWRQVYRRHRGEGRAEARVFDWSPWQESLLRYSLLPYGRQVIGDVAYCLKRKAPLFALRAPALRLAQMLGRRAGFLEGRRERQIPAVSGQQSTVMKTHQGES